ncbi:putative reverse transcriptase domain-containing protein, partial [Tanacetum coccineum]
EDFKKLLMEEYSPDDEIQKLESEFWNHKMVGSDINGGAVSMANRLTTDEIKDKIFNKKENTRDKKGTSTALVCWSASEVWKVQLLSLWNNYPRLNRATTSGGNRPNPVLAIEGNHKQRNNENQAHGRSFALGAAEAHFISTNFLPLINVKPSVICPGYKIEIANDLKIETNKIVRGCRIELEGHTFIINLIPFEHGSFDVIVGIDLLSKLKAKIVCYGKIVQIPLSNREILEVHGERPEGKLKQLKNMKADELKLKDILVVRNFPIVFLEDLPGLPPFREV